MQLSVSFIALAALLVNASPAKRSAVGATYSLTNVPTGNNVLVHAIGGDGKISFAHAVATGGSGIHGIQAAPETPDSLFGQGSVAVSGNNLYVVNSNSNTFTHFKIDHSDPTKLTKKSCVSTGGEFPTSITVSTELNQLCVLNGGKVNGVQCFHLDSHGNPTMIKNAFRPLGFTQTTPATGPFDTSSNVMFSADSDRIFVSVKGNPTTTPVTDGYVMAWDMVNGLMSQNAVKTMAPMGEILPFGMAPIKDSKAIISADIGTGATIYDFTNGTPAVATAITLPGEMLTCWVTYSKTTGHYFLTDFGGATVYEVAVDSSLHGSYVSQVALEQFSTPTDISVGTIGGHDFLYALQPNATSISVLSLASGNSKILQTYDFSSHTSAPITSINLQGMGVYIKN